MLNTAQIKHMVDRFLGWKLPSDFNPDAGITFKATFNEHTAHPMKNEPTGTNLFDFTQTDAMVRYMAEGMPSELSFRWLIEAPGQRYLAIRRIGSSTHFHWTQDHNTALYFRDESQADDVLFAIKELKPELFGFASTLGDAHPVEHGWV